MKLKKAAIAMVLTSLLTACTNATAQTPKQSSAPEQIAQATQIPISIQELPKEESNVKWKTYNDTINYDYLLQYPSNLLVKVNSGETKFESSNYIITISRYQIKDDEDNNLHGYEQARDRYTQLPYTGSKLLKIDSYPTVYYRGSIDNPASDGYQIFVTQQTPSELMRYVFNISVSAKTREVLDINAKNLERIITSFKYISKGYK